MKRPMKLTDADQQLLSVLRENARASTAQIARRLNLSRTTVQSRIERLERSGVIAGYTVRLGESARGIRLRATMLISTEQRSLPALLSRLKATPEVERVLTCAGRFDVMVQLAAADPAALDHALGQIAALPGITQAETLVHLATRLDRTA